MYLHRATYILNMYISLSVQIPFLNLCTALQLTPSAPLFIPIILHPAV